MHSPNFLFLGFFVLLFLGTLLVRVIFSENFIART